MDGAIRNWLLSGTLQNGTLDDALTLPAQDDDAKWTAVTTDASGVINLSEHLPADGFGGGDADRTTAIAKTVIGSDRERTVPLLFGYSDRIRVYLNGRVLYSGQNRFQEQDRRYQGLVSRTDTLYLDLREGVNELAFVMREDDRFGWGFLTEVKSVEGLVLR